MGEKVGGIMIMLGDLGDDTHMMGIDLDGCLNADGKTEPWAQEVIDRFPSYAEVSPSGKGVKIFFLMQTKNMPDVQQLMGSDRKGRKFSRGDHTEIGLDRVRFYTVTGKRLNGTKVLKFASVGDISWLLKDAGPRFIGKEPHSETSQGVSGSEHGFRFIRERKLNGETFEEVRAAILADGSEAGEWARRKDDRAFKLAWDKAPNPSHSWQDPDVCLLEDRRGDLPVFPLDSIKSPTLQDWLKRAAHGAGCTIDHVAVPLIGVASGLVGVAYMPRASKSWSEPVTTWVTIVGESGIGKTPGLNAVKVPLDHVAELYQRQVDRRRRQHETKIEVAKAALAEWKEQCKTARGAGKAAPEKPEAADDPGPFVEPRLYVADVTIEKMAVLLQGRPQGMMLIADELAGLFQNMRRYSEGGDDRQFWLMGWDGKSHSVERKSQPSIKIKHLLIGITGGMQPDKMSDCFKGAADGMVARALYAWPERAPYRELTDAIEPLDPKVVRMLDRLAKLGDDGGSDPLPLSIQARKRFEAIRKEVYDGLAAKSGREREWWSKIPSHVLRLAGTLTLMSWAAEKTKADPSTISDDDIADAEQLVFDYFWPHARACLRQIGLTERDADARQVLRWIKAKGKDVVSVKTIRRDALSHRLNAEETELVFKRLVRAGWLRRTGAEKKGRGRPAVRWNVNAKLHEAE